MNRRNPRAKWVLPEVVDPPERVCYIVPVPNDRQHIANFLGAIANLAAATQWQDDAAHTAKDVALVWREIFDGLLQRSCALIGGDDVQFRQNGCKLEFSIDCVHWSTLYDPTNCIAAGTTQPPGGGELEAGECREYVVTLQGNGQWLLPVPVQEGYSVTITDAAGGWNDGSGFEGWYCPNGLPYILGACAGVPLHDGGDPSPIAFHGELIALFGTSIAPASSGVINIPPGDPLEPLTFQMNDGSLADNAGSITFKVQVCATAVGTFSHTFDFTVSDGGWVLRDTGEGIYVAATGWKQDDTTGLNERLVIQMTVPADTTITSVGGTYDWAFGTGGLEAAGHVIRTFLSGSTVGSAQIVDQGTDQTAGLVQDAVVDLIEWNLYACTGFCTDGSVLLKEIVVQGLGTDPF